MTTAPAPGGSEINRRSAVPTFLASDVARTVDWYEKNLRCHLQLALKQQPYNDWDFEVRDLNGYVLAGSY